MDPKIGTLEIERFRALRKLRIEGLGRVNLITGRNNTGKSSILEALRIFASNASTPVVAGILRHREEDRFESDGTLEAEEGQDFSAISSLFTGLPVLGEDMGQISIATRGPGQRQYLTLSVDRFAEQSEDDGTRRLVPPEGAISPEAELILALTIKTETSRRVRRLEAIRRYLLRPTSSNFPEIPRLPCVYVSPFGSATTGALGPLWDNIALSDLEKEVVEALRIITPEIIAVSVIGGEAPRRTRTAIVRSSTFARPVPLHSYGDGLNRLFGILLSLVNAKDGLLLIDEIENGMHYSVQADLWRVIFTLSRRLNVQVFATSHSWDSVESFQQAANEDPAEKGVLIRLSRRGDDIVPTILREDELAIASRNRIEVR